MAKAITLSVLKTVATANAQLGKWTVPTGKAWWFKEIRWARELHASATNAINLQVRNGTTVLGEVVVAGSATVRHGVVASDDGNADRGIVHAPPGANVFWKKGAGTDSITFAITAIGVETDVTAEDV